MRWYWLRFRRRPLPVSVHLDDGAWRYDWSRIYGVQVGPWFVGAIQGRPADVQDDDAAAR